jgi:hypothetical protein
LDGLRRFGSQLLGLLVTLLLLVTEEVLEVDLVGFSKR